MSRLRVTAIIVATITIVIGLYLKYSWLNASALAFMIVGFACEFLPRTNHSKDKPDE